VSYSSRMSDPGHIACGLLMACGTAAFRYRCFSSRYTEGWKWRGTQAPVSMRSRVLASAIAASWTVEVITGMPIPLMFGPIVLTILLVVSASADHSSRTGL
jgi:hypothetical protein